MFDTGFWTLTHFAGAPVRIHWTVAILVLFLGGWEPVAWLGIIILIIVHELGHAMVVRAVGARVTEVMVYGFGGWCRWVGSVGTRQVAMIAWGGVLAQAVLLAVASTYDSLVVVTDRTTLILLSVFTSSNLSLILINLVPIPPLDGASAWPLVPMLFEDAKRWWAGRGSSGRRSRPASNRRSPTNGQAGKVIHLRPTTKSTEAPPPTDRITDPETADRMFNKVFKGLVDEPNPGSPDEHAEDDKKKDSNDPSENKGPSESN